MKIGVIKENLNIEKRISITPPIVNKLLDMGIDVSVQTDLGKHLGILNSEFESAGASIVENSEEILKKTNLILKVNSFFKDEFNFLKKEHILIGTFNSSNNKDMINSLLKKNVKIFSLDLLPRITRAQSMDVLSSQSNLAGYRAVIESIHEYGKLVPMMMTAAGTIPPAKVLVIGAGVAGLQAIATAKRLGAIVTATDVRLTAKEQVESLGGKFLTVDSSKDLETKEGYAKEANEDFKKKQEEVLKKEAKNSDIVICTALIPGKTAPRIITEDIIKTMKAGTVIYDLAVEQGGNSAFSEPDKIVNINNVKIIGLKNILNRLALTASNLYSNNLFNFVKNLYNLEKKDFHINMDDEIISKTLIKANY